MILTARDSWKGRRGTNPRAEEISTSWRAIDRYLPRIETVTHCTSMASKVRHLTIPDAKQARSSEQVSWWLEEVKRLLHLGEVEVLHLQSMVIRILTISARLSYSGPVPQKPSSSNVLDICPRKNRATPNPNSFSTNTRI